MLDSIFTDSRIFRRYNFAITVHLLAPKHFYPTMKIHLPHANIQEASIHYSFNLNPKFHLNFIKLKLPNLLI